MPPSRNDHEVTARLFKAIEGGDDAAVAELLEENPRLVEARNPEGVSPLLWAAYTRRPEICDLLLERGAEPDLFEAAALGLRDRVKALLQADRSRVDAFSGDGWTALHLAAHFGRTDVMRTLLAAGASHRAVSRNGLENQPLQAAVAGRRREAVDLLLEVGADANARSHGGITALHQAAAGGDAPLVRRLLEAGARPDAESEAGKTPLDFAREKGHAEVVEILEAAPGEG